MERVIKALERKLAAKEALDDFGGDCAPGKVAALNDYRIAAVEYSILLEATKPPLDITHGEFVYISAAGDSYLVVVANGEMVGISPIPLITAKQTAG